MHADITASSRRGYRGSTGGMLVVVCLASPHHHHTMQCTAACSIKDLIRSVALAISDPHGATRLSPGWLTFEWPGGETLRHLGGEEKGQKDKSVGGDVDLERWANVAGPMVLGIN